jgi:hypothetical protein
MVKTVKQVIKSFLPAEVRREAKRLLLGYPRICPQVYAWARQNPQHAEVVREFWGTHRRKRNPPRALGDQVAPWSFLQHLEYPLYEKTLLCIKKATICGADGLIFLPDGSISHQTAWATEQISNSPTYGKKWKGSEVFKLGNYSTLIYYWGLGYYHWFNDVLSTLHETLKLIPADTIFLMPQGFEKVYGGDFYLKSLTALGIARERIVQFDGTESWTLENLWWQPPASHDHTPGAMSWIGESISRSIPCNVNEKPVKIYISRKVPSARVVINESELIPVLKEADFVICQLEDLPFEEQVRLFRNAEIVVAPHGAGLTNLIFSKKGIKVLEIFSKNYERRCYWTLCEELGHDYHFYLGESEFPGRRGEPDIRVTLVEDFSKLGLKSKIW